MSARTAAPERRLSGRLPALPRPSVDNRLITVGLGLAVAALALSAAGGSALSRVTLIEIVLLLGGGVVIACGVLVAVRPRRLWGVWSLSLLLLLAALTAASIAWSINPADSWLEANRGFAYAAVFAAAVAVAHVAPHRWQALLGGLVLGTVLICVYSLATKVLPGLLAQDEIYARLRAPFGYWNAVGIAAAMAVPGCLWLGTRRHGHAAVSALAFPAMGIVLTTLLLSYSRGALIAVAVGCALWFVLVPLRLRGAVVLGTGLVVALFTALWTFGQAGLAQDKVELALRADAGLSFGLLLAAGTAVLTISGMAIGFAAAVHPPQPRLRRRAGLVTLCTVAMIPVGVLGALALSEGGIGGAVGSAVDSVTADTVAAPSNEPGRFLETESLRGLYWTEALGMFADNPVGGLGAGGYETARPRYGPDPIVTSYAHGFSFQVLADLGVIGGLLTAGLFVTWLLAATRAAGLRRGWRAVPFTPERVGLITLLTIVVTFGVQSSIDWTWVFPGVAVIALLAAAWVAGRGPFTETPPARAQGEVGRIPARLRAGVRSPLRAGAAAAVLLVAVAAAWTAWQPLRAQNAGQAALKAAQDGDVARARELAADARDRNPVAVEPLFQRSIVERRAGDTRAGLAALTEAVRLQPENPDPWLRLAEYELTVMNRAQQGLEAARTAVFLDPRSPQAARVFVAAVRAGAQAPPGALGEPAPAPPPAEGDLESQG